MDELVAFLKARIQEDEQTARAACDPQSVTGNEHWQWVDPYDDQVLPYDDQGAWFADSTTVELRSAERYPSSRPRRDTEHNLLLAAEEVRPDVGAHIAHHDPARVLRETAANGRPRPTGDRGQAGDH